MKNLAVIWPIALAVLCGCSRKNPAAAAQPTPEQEAQIESQYVLPGNAAPAATDGAAPAAASPARPAPNKAPRTQPIQERLQGAIHAQLTIQLRMFIEKNGRVPDSFSEFANSAMDTVPLAPDGMKYVIDPADRTVKAVKK